MYGKCGSRPFLRPTVNYSAVCSLMRCRLFALGSAHSGAPDKTRTYKVSRPPAPQAGAFTNFATSAYVLAPKSRSVYLCLSLFLARGLLPQE